MPKTQISTYSVAETFDVGRDAGLQTSVLYPDSVKFEGELDRVIITVSDENQVPPRDLPAMDY